GPTENKAIAPPKRRGAPERPASYRSSRGQFASSQSLGVVGRPSVAGDRPAAARDLFEDAHRHWAHVLSSISTIASVRRSTICLRYGAVKAPSKALTSMPGSVRRSPPASLGRAQLGE